MISITEGQYNRLRDHLSVAHVYGHRLASEMALNPFAHMIHAQLIWALEILKEIAPSGKEAADGKS